MLSQANIKQSSTLATNYYFTTSLGGSNVANLEN